MHGERISAGVEDFRKGAMDATEYEAVDHLIHLVDEAWVLGRAGWTARYCCRGDCTSRWRWGVAGTDPGMIMKKGVFSTDARSGG